MKPSHLRLAVMLATLAFAISSLGYAVVAQKQAADALATANVARRIAEAPRPAPQHVDLHAINAALERSWHEAHEARQCVELLWLATNTARRLWPDAPRWSMPASSCPLPPFDEIGSAREYRGVILQPGRGVRAALEQARRDAGVRR